MDTSANEAQQTIYVKTLGGFSITVDGKEISDNNNQSKKPWSLLEYLVVFQKKDISVNEPVSYTHLDVYKRQAPERRRAGGLRGVISLPRQGGRCGGRDQVVPEGPGRTSAGPFPAKRTFPRSIIPQGEGPSNLCFTIIRA